MTGYPGGRIGFLAVAIATHALVGYTLGEALSGAGRAGLAGGVIADVDLLVPATWGPLAHRGVTHSALALGVAVAIAARRKRATAGAFAAGYASQLLVDATTPRGVPLLWPLSPEHVGVTLGGHSGPVTAALWLCCLLALALVRRGIEPFRDQ